MHIEWENCHYNSQSNLCEIGAATCENLTASNLCIYYSGRLNCCWDYQSQSCASCSSYCPTLNLTNCAELSDGNCCSDHFSCSSCNNYGDCSTANDNPELCSMGIGCCSIWNEQQSMDCVSCSDANCYQLQSADCELNETEIIPMPFT